MKISYNLLGVITGVTMILACSFIAYIFQKNFFGKYRNKVRNALNVYLKPKP